VLPGTFPKLDHAPDIHVYTMNKISHIKKELDRFISTDKFKQYLHLQPAIGNSTEEDKIHINLEIDQCCRELLKYIKKKDPNDKGLRKIVRQSLNRIEDSMLDTEDREFCYVLFKKIGQITGVDIEENELTIEQKLLQDLESLARKSGIDLNGFLPNSPLK
jgi:hypothetical protein